jgi:hypothetical protein
MEDQNAQMMEYRQNEMKFAEEMDTMKQEMEKQ